MSATRYAPAYRPGRVRSWHVLRLPDGATVARFLNDDSARRFAGLRNALADELDRINAADELCPVCGNPLTVHEDGAHPPRPDAVGWWCARCSTVHADDYTHVSTVTA